MQKSSRLLGLTRRLNALDLLYNKKPLASNEAGGFFTPMVCKQCKSQRRLAPQATAYLFGSVKDKAGNFVGDILYRAQAIPGEGILIGSLGSLGRAASITEEVASSPLAKQGPVIIGETMARVE